MRNVSLTIKRATSSDSLNFKADDLTEQEGLTLIERMFATMGVPLAMPQQPVIQIVTETTSASAPAELNEEPAMTGIPNTPEGRQMVADIMSKTLADAYATTKPDDFNVHIEPTSVEGQVKVTVTEADATQSFEEALTEYDESNPMVQAMAKAKGIVKEEPKPGSKAHSAKVHLVKPPGRTNVRSKRDAQGTFNLIEHGVAITLYQTHTTCPKCGHDDRLFGREKNHYIKCENCKAMLRMERTVDRVSPTGPIADEDGDYFFANKIYEFRKEVPNDKSEGRSTPEA